MNLLGCLPSFDPAFANLHSGPLGLMEEKYQFDDSEQPTTYQGMSVQTLDTAFPIYPKQPDMDENNANSFNSLNDYGIEPVTLSNTAGFFGTDIPDIPASVLDEYIPDIPLIQQIFLSGSEPGISEPTRAGHSIPDCSLTNLPDVLPNPQDSRPFTAVNPLNLNQTRSEKQTPQAKETVDNSAKTDYQRKRNREFYHNNPDYAEREKKRQRDRYQNDPEYAESRRKRNRERYHILKSTRERKRDRQRERYQNDPEYAERERQRLRDRYHNNPDFAEREKKRNRERYQNDPAYLARKRARQKEYYKERYQNNPDFAERIRKRRRKQNKEA